MKGLNREAEWQLEWQVRKPCVSNISVIVWHFPDLPGHAVDERSDFGLLVADCDTHRHEASAGI